MMKGLFLLSLLAVFMFSCNDDDERASIVGSWRGDEARVEVKYGAIQLYQDNRQVFNVTVTFNADGTALLTDNATGTTSSGTYSLNGSELTTDVDFELYDLSGPVTFKVTRLTEQRLELQLNQRRDAEIQGYGNITIDIVGHLYFDRE